MNYLSTQLETLTADNKFTIQLPANIHFDNRLFHLSQHWSIIA